ncbi:hypothetical protein GIB67_036634 [Kingdonia uniflora]|uniref:Cation/H+ exchanger transmembrane domain-containing protein n=1 Tax=Kingdonia uniflora TaxID=39325 RepID=A0A7J7LWB6_9MAGN|nr:hypothetical protein GIB67_036634 [Kingdonia uniflora]
MLIEPKLKQFLEKSINYGAVLAAVTSTLSLTSFAVLYTTLNELKILNSDVGRVAMSTTVITDIVAWVMMVSLEHLKHADFSTPAAILCFASLCILILLVEFVFRPFLEWVIRKTPEGQEVDQCSVITILLLVLVSAFLSDLIGESFIDGPLLLGLVVPDGPPLGVALAKRTETIIMEFLMPFFYIFIGTRTNVFAITDWNALWSMAAIIFSGYITKFLGTVLPALFNKMSFRDAVFLGLIMNFRGQSELMVFIYCWDAKILTKQSFTLMVLCTILNTAIMTPLTAMLNKPTSQYTIKNRRTIEHSQVDAEI